MTPTNLKLLASELGVTTLTEAMETDISAKLERAEKLDSVETTTFGLETDDGQIVKVFVNEKDAEKFEKLMADCLGSTDSIEDAINKAAAEVDIVDVEWPEVKEEDEDEDVIDGSEALDPKVYGNADVNKDAQAGLKAKQPDSNIKPDAMTESKETTIASRFSTANQHLVFQAILDLGVPEEALNRSVYRSTIINGIKETALLMQTAPSIKTALKMFVKKRIDFESKIKDKEEVTESVLMEGATADMYWQVIDALLKAIDVTDDKHIATGFLELSKIATLRSRATTTLQSKVTPQIKAKFNALLLALQANVKQAAAPAVQPVQEAMSGADLASGFKSLLMFVQPKGLELVDAIFATTQGRLVITAMQRKANLLPQAVKMRLEQLLSMIKTVPVREEYDSHEFGTFEFSEEEAAKILRGLDNRVTTTVVSTKGIKLVLSPRRSGSYLKIIGSTEKAEITPEQVEQARSALA
jgi:hypothetical protein